jgi:hypothetical protein
MENFRSYSSKSKYNWGEQKELPYSIKCIINESNVEDLWDIKLYGDFDSEVYELTEKIVDLFEDEKQFDQFFNLIADVTSKLNSVFEEALTNHSEKPFGDLSKTHPSIAVLLIRENLVQRLNDENKSNSERQKMNYLH